LPKQGVSKSDLIKISHSIQNVFVSFALCKKNSPQFILFAPHCARRHYQALRMSLTKTKPLLSLRNAGFLLGDHVVFEDTSWTLRKNEQWAILGPNNSGKSLFADGLRGLFPVAQGELQYHFRPCLGLSAEESIAHVSFEERKLNIHDTVVQSRWNSIEDEGALRVRDYLSYERVMDINPFEVTDRHEKVRPQFEKRMRRAVRLLQVGSFLDRTLMSLSNGETQRVQLARTLAHSMRLLILDEPFAGLDARTRAHVHHMLERLMGGGLPVVLITTRPEDLPRHVSHVLCINDCRIVAAGARKELLSDPKISSLLLNHRPLTAKVRSGRHRNAQSRPPRQTLPWAFSKSGKRQRPKRGLFNQGNELVRMENVTVRYGRATILRCINWTINNGESWALLGANGSGKTALLSLILRDNPQVYGNNIRLFGQTTGEGESIWELKGLIGWVSPELHLYLDGNLSCVETVLSGLSGTMGLYESPSATQRRLAWRWLAWLNLAEQANQEFFTLSAGLQRMVLLARALVRQPRLLILDEPCQGLDASHRQVFIEAVDLLIRSVKLTTVFVTHRLDEIPPSIRRVLHLKSGRAREAPLEPR
jgi:molybdate transport system ATP-binding protein